MTLMERNMGRRKVPAPEPVPPAGVVLAANLVRLGMYDVKIRVTEVANRTTRATGRKMSRQQVANLLNAINISPEVLARLAKGMGVEPEELMRWPVPSKEGGPR